MSSKPRWPRPEELGRIALVSVLAVSAGYLTRLPFGMPIGSGLLGSLCAEGFHGAEGDFRWTRARSSLRIPDPGPGLEAEVELALSGFRPPGQTAPLVMIEAPGNRLRLRAGRRETIRFNTRTEGWWSSDLEIRIRSETYTPGGADRRSLGVRVHRLRWTPRGAPIGLERAPLRQLLFVTLCVLLTTALLSRRGVSAARAARSAYALSLFWAAGFAFWRPYAALGSFPFLLAAAAAFALSWLCPSLTDGLLEAGRASAYAARRGLRALVRPVTLVFTLCGILGVTAAYWLRSSIAIDLGTGGETTLLDHFAGFDQEQSVKFRRALRRARIDLRDFGGGSDWSIGVRASLVGRRQHLVLFRAGGREVESDLGPEWTWTRARVHAPFGWRSGLLVELPRASEAIELRIDRIHIGRARSLPSVRVVVYVVGTALVVLAGLVAGGLTGRLPGLVAGMVLGLELWAIVREPVLFVPFAPTLLAAAAASAAVVSLTQGLLTTAARRRITPEPVPAAMGAVGLGFLAWLASTLFPLYEGGHFVFHSSIAEEIWHGKFLTYYLPYPGSMLSRQAQWGNLVIPHPCTYHTLVAPLAALPTGWFYTFEKVVVCLMLASVAVTASLLATRAKGPRAGAYAAVFAVALPTSHQLLGLGHLMTICGVFAAALALGFITLRFEQLPRRRDWLWATLLLGFCFISYTASLLLSLVALWAAIPLLLRRAPKPARALVGAVVLALTAAFVLYYINWTLPFLRESLPSLLSNVGSTASESSLWHRIASWPHKLTYTYGQALLPLAGLAGLTLVRPLNQRILMLSWGGLLILFSVFDLFFNFLLKHHYFVLPVISAGCGLLADRLAQEGRWARLLVAALVISVLLLGAQATLKVALG